MNLRPSHLLAAIIITASAAFASCSHKPSADDLLTQATSALDSHDYDRAIALIDSLDHSRPDAIDARRRGMHLRALATEGRLTASLAAVDDSLLLLQHRADSLQQLMTWVPGSIEGYYVASIAQSLNPSIAQSLDARVAPDHAFYIFSRCPRRPAHTSVALVGPDGRRVETGVTPRDGERNREERGFETICLIGTDADTLASFIASHPGQRLTVEYRGESDTTVAPLTDRDAQAIATAWRYSVTGRQLKLALLRRERLERQLTVARNQTARTAPD